MTTTPELDILILRDPRESVKKCSLTPLRGQSGVRFVDHRPGLELEVGERLLLHAEGELLGSGDGVPGEPVPLLLLDCSWRRVPLLMGALRGEPRPRRLPRLETAYPRKSTVFQDPDQGLASVEALYAALALLGQEHQRLLADYRWAEEFLARNATLLGSGT